MSKLEATLKCRCGECTIILCDPEMRARVECLCPDCRQRAMISASKNPGNAVPDAVMNFERGVDLVYFTNAMIVDESSQTLLEFSKLTEDGMNTTAMTSCCGTLMCGVHPLYEGTTISVNADSCRVTTNASRPLQAVVFAGDISKDKSAALVERSEVPVVFSVFEEIESTVVQTFIGAVSAPITDAAKAAAMTNFEDLCADKAVTIDNSCFDESRKRYA